jgi:GT2 family glycosyltransferase
MNVYVVLVNFNGWADTLECLDTLFRSTHPEYRVLVCDNGSTDGSLERIAAWAARQEPPLPFARYGREEAEAGGEASERDPLVLIDCGGNCGFAAGNNVGLNYALARGDCDFAWLLNNDTTVHPEAMTHLVRRLCEQPDAGLASSTLLHHGDPGRVQALGGGWYCAPLALAWHLGRLGTWPRQVDRSRVEGRMSYPVGASVMATRTFLEQVGLLCEEYFLYFEELDWVLRSAGRFKVVYAPQSVVHHKVGGSIGTSSHPGRKSYACDYWNVRNRIFFTRRWFPWALPTVYLTLCLTLLARLLLGSWDRVPMVLRLMLGGWKRTPAELAGGQSDRRS